MAHELNTPLNKSWAIKAEKLRSAINREFWNPESQSYRHLVDPNVNSEHQEGLGLAFALLFDVPSADPRAAVYKNVHVSAAGIPCLYPSFERYVNPERTSYGRHSGTVWPHIQAFWGQAAARDGQMQLFANELDKLTAHVWRDKQFVEVYHPDTGLPYGGIQESNEDPSGRVAYLQSTILGRIWLSPAHADGTLWRELSCRRHSFQAMRPARIRLGRTVVPAISGSEGRHTHFWARSADRGMSPQRCHLRARLSSSFRAWQSAN